MDFPKDLKYTKEHTWAKVDGNKALIGITDHAQDELGDIVYVELPETGTEFSQGESFGSIESAKAVSELFSPLSGEIVDVNADLEDSPEVINEDPYDNGWMVEIEVRDIAELDNLMSAEEYKRFLEDEKK